MSYVATGHLDPLAQLPAETLNQMMDNDASFHDGTGIDDGAITAAKQGDSGWINPTFTNSYVVQNSRTVSYRKIGNRVFLRGQCGKATLDVNAMFTLPSGYRPSTVCIFSVPGTSGNVGKLTVDTSGAVNTPTPPPSSTYSGLDVVSFLVD